MTSLKGPHDTFECRSCLPEYGCTFTHYHSASGWTPVQYLKVCPITAPGGKIKYCIWEKI